MERKCSQTIKIPFPVNVFYGTEITVEIPKITNMIKKIRLVTNTNQIPIEKVDLVTKNETIESIYGDYIHIYNNFKTACEKRDKLYELISNGYVDIPFETIKDGLFVHDDLFVRILFKSGNSKIEGYLLTDYYITQEFPTTPFIHKTVHVSRFNTTVTSASRVKMDVYVPGPVYEIYFTVKDINSGEYVDAIKNICLKFSSYERFSNSGDYLRFIEPLKINGVYPIEPMYMYSFSIDNNSPGYTYFGNDSYFVIDLYENDKTYQIDIWPKSCDFLYIKDDEIKRMFISNELLLDVKTEQGNVKTVPLTISYINFSNRIQIFYQSEYDISNVSILDSNMLDYSISQNSILFTKIDSRNTEYYANVVFSSKGFLDTTCYFNIIGNRLYANKIQYNSNGQFPTHIDDSQGFHYVYGNTFDITNKIFTSNISSFSIDENKNYIFSTYTTTPSNIYGSNYVFPGPGSIIAAYDQTMNLLSYNTFLNSNVCLGDYGKYSTYSGGIDSSGINAGNSLLLMDYISGPYSSGRVLSSSNPINGSNFGINSDRAFLFSSNSLTIVSNILPMNTQLKTDSNGNPIWGFMYSNKSLTSDGLSFTSNGYYIKSNSWNMNISNVNSSSLNMRIMYDTNLENTYITCGYDNTTPQLSNNIIQTGTGFFVVKVNKYGKIQYVTSFTGFINNYFPMVDSTTDSFILNVITSQSKKLNIYNNGNVLLSNLIEMNQFFTLDDYGSVNTNSDKNLNELFSINKSLYPTYKNTDVYFKYNKQPINYDYWCVYANPYSYTSSCFVDENNSMYIHFRSADSSSNVFDKYGDSGKKFTYQDCFCSLLKINEDCTVSDWKIGIKSTDLISNSIKRNNYIYMIFNTNYAGAIFVNNFGTSSINIPSYARNIIVLRFNMDGSYSNWYMNIPDSTAVDIVKGTNNDMYIIGTKDNTSSIGIFVNGIQVQTIPVTRAGVSTSFVVKINQADQFSWFNYVENAFNMAISTDNSNNVYINASKNLSVSNIYGSVSDFIPSTNAISSFVIKLDSNGQYTNWNILVSCLVPFQGYAECYARKIKNDSNGNVIFGVFLGSTSLRAETYAVVLNGVTSININKVGFGGEDSFILKFDQTQCLWSLPPFANARISDFKIDKDDNIIGVYVKSSVPCNILDKNWRNGTTTGYMIPSTTGYGGVILRTNSDGTYSDSSFAYTDSLAYDEPYTVEFDNNGKIISNINLVGINENKISIFDKNGYVTAKFTNRLGLFSCIIKYNSDFTINKISL